jgi:hypothetical protein
LVGARFFYFATYGKTAQNIFMTKTVLIFIFYAFGLACASSEVRASEVQTQTTSGTGLFTEALSYNGDNQSENVSAKKGGWNWDLSYSYSAIKLGSTVNTQAIATGASASDHTSSVTGGFGYADHWELGLDLNYSKTSEENLSSFGPSVHLGYTFDLAKRKTKPTTKIAPATSAKTTPVVQKEEEDEPFVPTLNFTTTLGTTKYDQDYLTTPRAGSKRKVIGKAGTQVIAQQAGELFSTLSAVEWLDVEVYVKGYHYNRDVGTFLANLDDPRAVRSGAASFGSTLEGFSSNEVGADFTLHFPLDIDLHPEFYRSTSAVDGSKTNSYKVDLSKLWAESWKTGIGYERDTSPTDTENSGILTLSYEF